MDDDRNTDVMEKIEEQAPEEALPAQPAGRRRPSRMLVLFILAIVLFVVSVVLLLVQQAVSPKPADGSGSTPAASVAAAAPAGHLAHTGRR